MKTRHDLRNAILLLAVAAGCTKYNTEMAPMNHEIQSLAETTVTIDGRQVSITVAGLEEIKGALLQKLDEDPARHDLNSLRKATTSEPCFISKDGVGHIGAWALRMHAKKPVLVRTVPRSDPMLIPVAILSHENGRWQVLRVDATVVRGR